MENNDGCAVVFPTPPGMQFNDGITLRDYFAAHSPAPDEADISRQMELDRNRNPHNDGPPKPPRRSRSEIACQMRYEYADAMLAERSK